MKDRASWELGATDHRNLVEFSRPCATCGVVFSIFVTQRIASGMADTNNFGLRNCEKHRRSCVQNNSKKFPWEA